MHWCAGGRGFGSRPSCLWSSFTDTQKALSQQSFIHYISVRVTIKSIDVHFNQNSCFLSLICSLKTQNTNPWTQMLSAFPLPSHQAIDSWQPSRPFMPLHRGMPLGTGKANPSLDCFKNPPPGANFIKMLISYQTSLLTIHHFIHIFCSF